MNDLINLIRKNASDSIKNLGYEIYHIEYVKELGHNYLRIMIEHDDNEQKITVKDCEIVSKTINGLIDDFNIDDKFFLEVSSPGVNRKLYTLEHMKNSINQLVCVKLKKAIDGNKKFIGVLKNVDENEIVLKIKDEDLKIGIDMMKNINLEEISQEDIHE